MEKIVCGMIKGRHKMPVETYIFNEAIENPHDYKGIHAHISAFIRDNIGVCAKYGEAVNSAGEDSRVLCGEKELVVYVTGLTPVTVELVKICLYNGISLTLMNYDTSSGEYVPQFVY